MLEETEPCGRALGSFGGSFFGFTVYLISLDTSGCCMRIMSVHVYIVQNSSLSGAEQIEHFMYDDFETKPFLL